jgi:hypothetical protein
VDGVVTDPDMICGLQYSKNDLNKTEEEIAYGMTLGFPLDSDDTEKQIITLQTWLERCHQVDSKNHLNQDEDVRETVTLFEKLTILSQIALSLSELHDIHIMHGNLTMKNCLVLLHLSGFESEGTRIMLINLDPSATENIPEDMISFAEIVRKVRLLIFI